ncbi:hypothetical protein GE061_005379 [Apolygus lucorum]|uniref:FeS cluster biogenesis domain-containing protein n=1 Tax=Apolygus lucorum TaxID=248454 RepID=A0A8S9WW08_APOLU|nr:hypothetical protein GE061_005379 [Apolygus lucorum]
MTSKIAAASIRAVKARKPFATRAALVLTPSAVQRVKALLSERPDAIGVKVGVLQRGCNGLSYTLDYCLEKNKMDEEVLQDGVRELAVAVKASTSENSSSRRSAELMNQQDTSVAHRSWKQETRFFPTPLCLLQ